MEMGSWVSHLPRSLLSDDDATSPPSPSSSSTPSPFPPPVVKPFAVAAFRPSIAIIVGVLTTLFSLTFLLLLYAKHCKRTNPYRSRNSAGSGFPNSSSTARRNSGVERGIVESLPLFRFGALRGQKEGLECAVCLSKFDPAELLRLLPKCKHAFHVECVDTWLDAHSTCPLCRCRVHPEDIFLLPHPDPAAKTEAEAEELKELAKVEAPAVVGNIGCGGFVRSGRVLGRHSSAGERSSTPLQVVVQRPSDPIMRKSVDDGILRTTTAPPPPRRKDLLLPTMAETPEDNEAMEKRFGHRIIVSSGGDLDGAPERWSDLRPSDLLFLRSEMIMAENGRYSVSLRARASCSSAVGGGRGAISSRCESDITSLSRYASRSNGRPRRVEEERAALRRWLGFAARRTAQWLGNRRGGGETNGPNT